MRRGAIRFLPGLFVLLGCFSLTVAQIPAPNSFFDFEETAGNIATDQGSAANHGNLEGDAIQRAADGIVTKKDDPKHCVEFTGDAFTGMGFVLVPYKEYLNSSSYTLSAWVEWIGDANWGYVFWADGITWPEEKKGRHIDVWWNPDNRGIDCILNDVDGTEFRVATTMGESGVDMHDGIWHMVTVTLENESLYSIYLDGFLAAEGASSVPIVGNDVDDLWLGARPNDATMTNPVKMIGFMDRVRIWDTALNADQIDALYTSEGPDGGTTEVEALKPAAMPSRFGLSQNYPNPFNPTTRIQFSLETQQQARVTVYDLMGRPVRTLFDGVKAAGQHEAEWDGKNEFGSSVSSGMYMCRLTAGQKTSIRKITLLQ
jgi:hypothetical protein